MPSFPPGVVDGPFVRFDNWDVPNEEFNSAYFPHLQGPENLNKLKEIALEKRGHQYYAFNTWGWMKSWAILDPSQFRSVPGCSLYVRVEYPGWHFTRGKDSNSNDDTQMKEARTATGLLGTFYTMFPDNADNNRIAAINTNGWVKTKVHKPLTAWPTPGGPLAGIYIRTEFRGYHFYPLRDSNSNDIGHRKDLVNNVPALIKAAEAMSNAAGFNTAGWIKNKIAIPPPPTSWYKNPTEGIYVRIEWPDFVYLPGLDSPAHDIEQTTGKQTWELIAAARQNSKVVTFNTNGWMKSDVVDMPVEITSSNPLFGLYVKVLNITPSSMGSSGRASEGDIFILRVAQFILKCTAIIWGGVMLDAPVRARYRDSVAAACQETLAKVREGTVSALDAVKNTHAARENLMRYARTHTTRPGRLIAQGAKPVGSSYQTYLGKYSQRAYNRPFAELTREESVTVAIDTIKASGRASLTITSALARGGKIFKGTLVIGVAVSVYEVTVADAWKHELGDQVASWSGAILGGELGVEVGAIVGPAGAVLGGIAGGIIGGLAGEGAFSKLASWFFGSTSGRSAGDLFGRYLGEARKHVKERLRLSGRNFHVHQLLAGDLAAIASSDLAAMSIIEKIINTPSVQRRPKDDGSKSTPEVIATIVWVQSGPDAYTPANAANPGDMVILMNWVTRNLPIRLSHVGPESLQAGDIAEV